MVSREFISLFWMINGVLFTVENFESGKTCSFFGNTRNLVITKIMADGSCFPFLISQKDYKFFMAKTFKPKLAKRLILNAHENIDLSIPKEIIKSTGH
jgi:hypothetical protein